MRVATLCLAIAVAGCSSSSSSEGASTRSYNRVQGYSVNEPTGWSRQVDSTAATIYRGTGEHAKHTIVIRSTSKPSMLSDRLPATPENIEQQTKVAIMSLPGARLKGTRQIENASGPAEELAFTFRPQSGGGRSYQRRHVVIVGATKIFHVFYTAPANETVDAEQLDAVVTSLREEA